MAKTKTLGIRTTQQLIDELEKLKDAFAFGSYSELLGSLAQVLRTIDQRVCQVQEHPRTWEAEQIRAFFSTSSDGNEDEIARLMWRRLKQRFGEDGVEVLRRKLLEDRQRTKKS